MYTTEQEMNNFLDEYKRSRVIIESTVTLNFGTQKSAINDEFFRTLKTIRK